MVLPRILVTVDEGVQPRGRATFSAWVLKRAYADAVVRAGGLPLLAPPGAEPEALADAADGLVVTGGAFDVPPAWSGTERAARIDLPQIERSRFERALLEAFRRRGCPALGVCGGMQLMVVLAGGRLVGDIRTEHPEFGEHEQPTGPDEPWHEVAIGEGTWLAERLGRRRARVNSTHHQGVVDLPPGLRVLASAGRLIEAVDDGTSRWVGVQWHPELLDDDLSRALYANLVREALRNPT
jgi:putative glutamine amidotransferase